jgi:hypothetical protein
MSWFFLGASLVPSINVPARITVSGSAACGVDCARATLALRNVTAKENANK